MKNERVAILGASDNQNRYSYKAFKMLKQFGHTPLLVSPRLTEIDGELVHPNLNSLKDVDTLTVYVNPKVSDLLEEDIFRLNPGRVIFNPGSENDGLMDKLKEKKIPVEEACTLVLLTTDQF